MTLATQLNNSFLSHQYSHYGMPQDNIYTYILKINIMWRLLKMTMETKK